MKLNEKEVEKLANIMKNKRVEFAYTLEQVRLKLEFFGISAARSDIQRIEEGERKIPNPILLSGLCKIYGIDTVLLFEEIGYIIKKEKLTLNVAECKIDYMLASDNVEKKMKSEKILDLSKLNKKEAESLKVIYDSLLKNN
ncbi:hypothetical protein [Fusobacterium gastrosuis]|uniref:hypothetical protein n=1 Tax=Fusobacterium gastrosuis TaxID=1755100 RepID=UPI00297263E7|nr:hypothetical protein [Fusobacteriaceae bacterium]MDY5713659.1 hypothetical protein [Fusobacterium gastrosuis]